MGKGGEGSRQGMYFQLLYKDCCPLPDGHGKSDQLDLQWSKQENQSSHAGTDRP